jgi:hypothetical protein
MALAVAVCAANAAGDHLLEKIFHEDAPDKYSLVEKVATKGVAFGA